MSLNQEQLELENESIKLCENPLVTLFGMRLEDSSSNLCILEDGSPELESRLSGGRKMVCR